MIEYFLENPHISGMAISVVSIVSASIYAELEKRKAQEQIRQGKDNLRRLAAEIEQTLSSDYVRLEQTLSSDYVRREQTLASDCERLKQSLSSYYERCEQTLTSDYERHKQSLTSDYERRKQSLSSHYERREQTLNSNVSNLLGISYDELDALSRDFNFSRRSAPYLKRARGYVRRLEDLNKKRMSQLEQKPVTTTAASRITRDQLQVPLSIQERLLREIEICKQKAIDLQISPPIGTEPVECEIIRVIDGDTFLISANNNTFRLRVAGFDTPEVCHPTKGFGHWGIQASAAAESYVASGQSFKVFLDKKSFEQYGLFNDRYGRIVGHITINDVLLGQMMLSAGHAELVDFFPIDEEILSQYRLAEFAAKQENMGMWKDINEFNLMKEVNRAREKKYKFQEIVETNFQIDFTKEIIKQIFVDLVGNTVVRSKNGVGKIHNHGCRYLKTIKETEEIHVDETWVEENANNLLPCKVCNGDDIILELTG